jgi:hypothetical protein
MPRSDSDAVAARPTVEQEMAAFKGFSTENGETITKDKPEDLNPVAGKNQSAAEIEANKDKVPDAKAGATKPAAKAEKLTDAESEVVIADLDKQLGREATEEEISAALTAASAKKGGADPAKTKTVQDRINKAVKAQRAAERQLATERSARLAAEAALAAGAKAPLTADDKGGKDDSEGAPDPKKFEYGELDANYIRALARYEAKQELAAARENEKKVTLTAAQQADKEKFEAAKAAFEDAGAEAYEDFDEVVMQGARDKAWPLSDTLGAVLMTSDYGPQIAYELASDPKEAKRIFDMAPLRQVAWLGRKEAELESAGSGAKSEDKGKAAADPKVIAQVSKAPAPVTRIRGQGSASTVPGDTQDFAAFEAAAMGRKTR